jgi:tetratricopeptide (TPR) repeat protein
MGELLRQRGQYEDAAEMIASALETARLALEDAHERAATTGDDGSVSTDIVDGPSLDEQRNAIVDLIIQNAGMFMSANRFDEAAEAYERALSSHVYFRRWSEGNVTMGHLPNKKTVLPANTSVSTKPPKLDLTAATKIEATIRRNLADALAQIGQDNLSLEHYAASLAIKRHIGGDLHLEVAHTLMDMGALTGGPLRDFAKALNCFKEALYIYRSNLEECSRANGINGDDRNANSSVQTFFDDEHTEEINRSVEKALKNISLIDAALLKDRDGATSKKRR